MPTEAPPDNKLADLDKSGSPVNSRVADASHALKICRRFVNDDRERMRRRMKVQGAFDGNAPKNQGEMIKAGRGSDSNLNFKRHRGHIMNAWTPFFDLVCEVPVCIDGELECGDPAQDAEAMRGFAEYFHEMQFTWSGWDDLNQLTDLQMLLHGPGIMAREDPWDWRPKPILAGNFYVPSETNCSLDNCEMVMLTTPRTAGQLWRSIATVKGDAVDYKAADAAGWNVEAVKNAIMSSALNGSEMRSWKWDRWEQAFKNGDIYVTQTQTKQIHLFTLFVEEMDGTISQKIVPAKESEHDGAQFLYDSNSRYECWDQCIHIFPYDIGADGTFHSIKGLGTDILPFCALLDNIDNSIADLVVTSIKPMWQPTTNAKMDSFKMASWGGGKFIPNGLNPVQLDISRGIAPATEVSRYLTQTLSGNTATANLQDFAAPTVEETAKSAMIRASERAKVSKGLHNRYMRGKDRQYAETWRRAVNPKLRPHHPGAKEALAFQARCYALCDKLGLPHEALQMVRNVHANRSLGLGSPAMRIEIADQLMSNIDRFDEIGQNEIKRMWTAVMTNYHSVDAIVPSLTTGRDKTNDEAVAAAENNSMTILGPDAEVIVTPAQDHVLHLQTHIPSAQKDQQACEAKQLDPRECFRRLEAKGAHSNEHLAVLQKNPTRKQEAKAFGAALKELAAYQDHLEQVIAQEDQAAAEQPQPGEVTPEMAKVHGELALKAQKDQGQLSLKAQQQEFKQQMAAQQAEFERRLKDLQAASDINRKTTEHRTDQAIAMDAHMREMDLQKNEPGHVMPGEAE